MRHSRKLLGLAAVLLFAACDSGITNPLQEASGSYALTVYAGRAVPATYTIPVGDQNYPNGATFVVTGGELALHPDGTFIETNNYVTTPTGGSGQQSAFVSSGTWSVSGDNLILSAPAQNGNLARNISGTLTFDSVNDVFIISYQEDDGTGLQSFEYQDQR